MACQYECEAARDCEAIPAFEDMDKTLVTCSAKDVLLYAQQLTAAPQPA